MRFAAFFLLTLAISCDCLAKMPGWAFATSGSHIGTGYASSVAVDRSGNIYVAGSFTDSLIFGSTKVISHGRSDIYLAKYDFARNPLWVKSAGSVEMDGGAKVAVDTAGNVYFVAGFYDTIVFNGVQYISKGDEDLLLSKMDGNGNNIWTKSFGTVYGETPYDLQVKGNNLAICGLYASPINPSHTPTPLTFGTDTIVSIAQDGCFFVAKFDLAGNELWARSASGVCDNIATGLVEDNNGAIYLHGDFRSPYLKIDTVTLLPRFSSGNGSFLAKYDNAGHFQWVRSLQGNLYAAIYSDKVALDKFGAPYISGLYTSSQFNTKIYFDNSTTFLLTDPGSFITYWAKYSPDGELRWAKGLDGGCADVQENSLTSDTSGVYIGGSFGGGTFDSITLPCNATCFVAKYDTSGHALWVQSGYGYGATGGGGEALGMSADGKGSVYVTGNFGGSVSFDHHIITASSANSVDLFIAKLSPDAPTGISGVPKEEGFTLLPNPATDVMTIKRSVASEEAVITLFNAVGQPVGSVRIPAGQQQAGLSVSRLPAGMYMIRLQAPSGTETQRLLVQH